MSYPTYLTKVEREVREGREAAHAKHGINSIEAQHFTSPNWLPILIEEVGEAAATLTYDKNPRDLRAELVDILCVAQACVDAIDRAAGAA